MLHYPKRVWCWHRHTYTLFSQLKHAMLIFFPSLVTHITTEAGGRLPGCEDVLASLIKWPLVWSMQTGWPQHTNTHLSLTQPAPFNCLIVNAIMSSDLRMIACYCPALGWWEMMNARASKQWWGEAVIIVCSWWMERRCTSPEGFSAVVFVCGTPVWWMLEGGKGFWNVVGIEWWLWRFHFSRPRLQ